MDRRKFISGATAAAITAAVTGRQFVRSIEDREEAVQGEVLTTEYTDLIFKLYDNDELIHEETRPVTVTNRGSKTYLGVKQQVVFVIEDSVWNVTHLKVALASIPTHVIDLELFDGPYRMYKGDTLTFEGQPNTGFVELG